MANIFYHGIIRKAVVAFGTMFSSISFERKSGDSVTGTTIQTIQVPLAYAPKEKWIQRLEGDPNLNQHTYVSLPRMSFEITGLSYDAQRKLGKLNTITCNTSSTKKKVFSPVPYNLEMSLYILTKNNEDAFQILENILPTFGPEYTLAIQAVPGMNIIQDIPVSLNSMSLSDEYDGDFQTRRFVIWTLNFTLKLNLYGNPGTSTPIYTSIANLSGQADTSNPHSQFTTTGDPETYTIVEEGWDEDF